VTLSWTVADATNCTASGGSGGWSSHNPAHIGGSHTVIPAATANYNITCTGPGGSDSDSVPVNFVGELGVTLSTGGAVRDIGSDVRWLASPSGGRAPYTFTWSGEAATGPFGTLGNNEYYDKTYGTTGLFTSGVEVTDGSGQTASDSHTLEIEDNRTPQ